MRVITSQKPAIESVVPKTSTASVMTAPAATKYSGVVTSTTVAKSPVSTPPLRAARRNVIHATSRHASSDGSRAANSLTPSPRYAIAVIHVDSGGLLQNATPYLYCGVTQSPVSTILRAISA